MTAAKDIAADDVLAVIRAVAGRQRYKPVATWDIYPAFPDVPYKVVLAKLRRLVAKGVLDGCTCGCRGDFTIDERIGAR